MTPPGRNDPCPCGSGKKFKRCCLNARSSSESFLRLLDQEGLPLLRDLARYATQRPGTNPEAIAREYFPFWRPPLDRVRTARLIDFLIFDRHAGQSRSAIAEYESERGPLASEFRRSLLAAWQVPTMALYEVEEATSNRVVCHQVLPERGASIEVRLLEAKAGTLKVNRPAALRALPLGDAHICTGWPVTFDNRSVEDVSRSMVARHHAYVQRERIVGIGQFFRVEPTAFDAEAAAASASALIVPGTM